MILNGDINDIMRQSLGKTIYLVLILITAYFWDFGSWNLNAIWMGRFFAILCLLLLPFIYDIGKKISWYAVPIACVALYSGLATCMWFPLYSDQPFEIQSVVRQCAGLGLIFLFITTYFVMKTPKNSLLFMLKLFGYFSIPLSLCIIFSPDGPHLVVPIVNNPSMAGTLVAITLFLIPRQPRLIKALAWILGLTAIYMTKASIPLGTLGVGLFFKLIYTKYRSLLFAFIPIPFFIPRETLSNLLDSNGRFVVWKTMMKWWWESPLATILFGNGLSTTRALAPMYQEEHHFRADEMIFWLHNDYLQVTMELGLIGLACMLLLWARMARNIDVFDFKIADHTDKYFVLNSIRKRRIYAAPFMAYSFAMLVNYPFHWPIHALLGVVLGRACLYE